MHRAAGLVGGEHNSSRLSVWVWSRDLAGAGVLARLDQVW